MERTTKFHLIHWVDQLPQGKIGRMLPSAQAREWYAQFTNRLLYTKEQSISSADVKRFFISLEEKNGRMVDAETIEAIKFHKQFFRHELTTADLQRIEWYFQPNQNHISHYLTNGGRDKSLLNVAYNFLHGHFQEETIQGWKETDVNQIIDEYQQNRSLPPVILSERPKGMRPTGKLHIIDGVHRLLGLTVCMLNTERLPHQQAFIA